MEQTNPTKYKQMLSQLMIDIKIGYSKLLEIKKIVKNGKNLVISQTELTNKDADGQDVTDNLSYQSTDESNESDNPATHMMKEEYKKLDSKLKADLKKILTELE
ncbi:hypothetical protein FACS1894166_07920 [Bacilli bacterium]|nr:hypothetical protein FACS1894166_07920 [Bacilli bacterium]